MNHGYRFDNACVEDRKRQEEERKQREAKERAAPDLYAACIKAKRALLYSNHHTAYNAIYAALAKANKIA